MKTIDDLVSHLHALNVKLWVEGDRLRYRAPQGTMTPALTKELQGRKAEILRFLDQSNFASIQAVPDREYYDLSHAQRRLWILSQIEEGSAAYNIPLHQLFEGELDLKSLEEAIARLVQRHESLRTTFVTIDGEPRQKIHEQMNVQVGFVDLTDEPQARETARKLGHEEARKPFDLEKGPLVRVTLVKLDDKLHVMLFTIHHIVSDGVSISVLTREFGQLYESIHKGTPDPLSPLRIQYRDYASWQNHLLESKAMAVHSSYWREKLSGKIPVLDLPTDFLRPSVQTFNGRELSFNLDLDRLNGLLEFSRGQTASLFMTLLALVKVLLYRYTGQEDIIVGSPIAGRIHADLEDQVGFYLNTLPLRDQIRSDASFESFLQQVKQTATQAYDHQIYPLDRLIDELNVERNLSRSPLFDVILTLQNQYESGLACENLTIRPFFEHPGTSKVDLTFCFKETRDSLLLSIEYNSDLFLEDRIKRMGCHFQELVDAVLDDPTRSIGRLNIVPEWERRQLLNEFNPDTDYSCDKTIVDLFEEQARKMPYSVAVVYEDRELTYRELNARANQLAHHLRSLGVRTNDLVGICADRSLDMVVGLLGILKAGAAYVPFDLAYPGDRLAFMLNDCQVPVLLTQQALASGLPPHQAQVLCLDKDWDLIARHSQENPASDATPANLAYVIYTSGSTGQPKGTLVSHHNVTRLFAATRSWFHFDHRDVWTLFHSYAFDFSVWELWGALLHGGRLVVVPYWVSRSPEAFYDLLRAQRVTVLNQTPSAFRQLIQVDQAQAASLTLRLVIFGGEALELQSLKPWFDRHGDHSPLLVNMYGITETTVHVTYRPLTRADLKTTASLIGIPIPDLQVYILDSFLQPVPIGIPGEMYVGGAGLAQSYLRRPELTADRFIPNPFTYSTRRPPLQVRRPGSLSAQRRYRVLRPSRPPGQDPRLPRRTGRNRSRPGHSSRCPTRRRHSPARPSRRQAPGGLCCPQPAPHPPPGELRALLKEKLPDYMMPANFVILDTLPLTANGKIDRHALPAPDQSGLGIESTYEAPRNDLERIIADMWQEVLNVEKVGIHDNFFELGGHSLKAARVISMIQRMGIRLALVDVFREPTPAGLAEVARTRGSLLKTDIRPLEEEPHQPQRNVIAPATIEELEMLNE